MRLPLMDRDNAADIDIEQTKKMVDVFMEKGFTYFDTAWMYHAFNSENAIKAAVVDRYPRESFTVASKLHAGFFDKPEGRDEIFNKQLEKTGAGYFDYYLLHGITDTSIGKYEALDCFSWIQEKKAAGLVKHIGFSFHGTPELLDELLTKYPFFEFVQIQLNYLDWNSQGIRSKDCYDAAVKHNVPVIVMEPVKGGTLANVPDSVTELFKTYDPEASIASWAIRFAASLDNVMCVLSGMSSIEQMDDNLSYMDNFKPLNAEELKLVEKAAELINENIKIPCTGCSYCTEGCPMNIPIPKYFSLYNADFQEVEGKEWLPQESYYENLTKTHGKGSDCIACGQCESVCPQHLNIIELMAEVAKHFEEG